MEHIFILKSHILCIVIYQQYMFKYMVIIHIFIFVVVFDENLEIFF